MSFTPANPTGWAPYQPVTADQLNHIDNQLVQAVDGVGGGTYSGPIELTGCTGLSGPGDIWIKDIECNDIECNDITMDGVLILTNPAGSISMSGGSVNTGGGLITTSNGAINTGSGTITTTGVGSFGSVNLTSGGITYGTTTFTKWHSLRLWYADGAVILATGGSGPFVGGQFAHGLAVGTSAYYDLAGIPAGSTITKVEIWIQPTTAHSVGDTIVAPELTLYSQLITADQNTVVKGNSSDTTWNSSSPGPYNALHSFALNFSPGFVLAADTTLYINLKGEDGANGKIIRLTGIRTTYTRTSVPMGGA